MTKTRLRVIWILIVLGVIGTAIGSGGLTVQEAFRFLDFGF